MKLLRPHCRDFRSKRLRRLLKGKLELIKFQLWYLYIKYIQLLNLGNILRLMKLLPMFLQIQLHK